MDDATGGDEILNVFKHDTDYVEKETKYRAIENELLDEDSVGSSRKESDSSEEEEADKATPIVDATETNLIALSLPWTTKRPSTSCSSLSRRASCAT